MINEKSHLDVVTRLQEDLWCWSWTDWLTAIKTRFTTKDSIILSFHDRTSVK